MLTGVCVLSVTRLYYTCRGTHLCLRTPVVGGRRCHRLSCVALQPVALLSCLGTRVGGGEERKQGLASCPLMSTPGTSHVTSGGAALGQQGAEMSRWIAGWGGSWRGGHRPTEVPREEGQADTPPLCLLKPTDTCVSSSASAASSAVNCTRGGEAARPQPGPGLSTGHCPVAVQEDRLAPASLSGLRQHRFCPRGWFLLPAGQSLMTGLDCRLLES